MSAEFRQRTNPESTGERPRERTRRLLVHVKRFVPRNIEFVVYRSFARVTDGINFRLSAITSDPEYLAQSKNLPITTGEPDIPSASITNVPSATDVFQIKVHHFPRCCNRIWPGRTIRRKYFREIFADRRIGLEKITKLTKLQKYIRIKYTLRSGGIL